MHILQKYTISNYEHTPSINVLGLPVAFQQQKSNKSYWYILHGLFLWVSENGLVYLE